MKVKKYELVRIIDKLKSVVQKNTVHPALGGVLVKEGYLIAANGEITIQVKCEDAEGESFIIPMKAFDLIKNLPEGDVELLHDDKNVVTIKMEKSRTAISHSRPRTLSTVRRIWNRERNLLFLARASWRLFPMLSTQLQKRSRLSLCWKEFIWKDVTDT